jgi:hypothetical protein
VSSASYYEIAFAALCPLTLTEVMVTSRCKFSTFHFVVNRLITLLITLMLRMQLLVVGLEKLLQLRALNHQVREGTVLF